MPKKKTTRKSRASARNKAADKRAKKIVQEYGGSRTKAAKRSSATIRHNTRAVGLLKKAAQVQGFSSVSDYRKGAKTLKAQKATRSAIRARRKK